MASNGTWHPLNWHIPPWGTNPNDWLDRGGLIRPDGTPVRISRGGVGVFKVKVGDAYEPPAHSLLACCVTLNALEVGQGG